MDKELSKWVQSKVQVIQDEIVRSFKLQRDSHVKSIEGQAEFDVGDAAFSEVERSLKLLGKQFMLENGENPDNLRMS